MQALEALIATVHSFPNHSRARLFPLLGRLSCLAAQRHSGWTPSDVRGHLDSLGQSGCRILYVELKVSQLTRWLGGFQKLPRALSELLEASQRMVFPSGH